MVGQFGLHDEGQLSIIQDRIQDSIRGRGNNKVEEDVRSMESCSEFNGERQRLRRRCQEAGARFRSH